MDAGSRAHCNGSPFEPVFYQDESYEIAQCNNAYIFPGLGLGVLAGKLTRVTDTMLSVASKTLAAFSPLANTEKGGLLPPVDIIETVSKAIALQVAQAGQQEGVGPLMSEEELTTRLENIYWDARYKAYKRASF